jgi:hypothetical protein
MSGYVVNLRVRRAGAPSSMERTWAFADGSLRLFAGRGAFVLGILLLLLAPIAMTALTRPETGTKQTWPISPEFTMPSNW